MYLDVVLFLFEVARCQKDLSQIPSLEGFCFPPRSSGWESQNRQDLWSNGKLTLDPIPSKYVFMIWSHNSTWLFRHPLPKKPTQITMMFFLAFKVVLILLFHCSNEFHKILKHRNGQIHDLVHEHCKFGVAGTCHPFAPRSPPSGASSS